MTGAPAQPLQPSTRQELRATLALALPLIAGQLSHMLIGLSDTAMIGRLGVIDLGAATFANTLLLVPLILGLGLLSAVSVRVAQACGAGQPADAEEALRHGTGLALIMGLATISAILLLLPALAWFRQPQEVTERVPSYLLLSALSLLPAFLSMAWKNFADALNHPWPAFWILFGGVLLNIALNALLIWGYWGFPALGLEGAGWASLIARSLTALTLFVWLLRSRHLRHWLPPDWLKAYRPAAFRRLLSIGTPASLHMLTEIGAFAMASLLIGTLGVTALAAHQIALTCISTTFMVPFGLSMAMTVRVGQLIGAEQRQRLHRTLVGGLGFAVGFMSLTMLTFLLAGHGLAAVFVQDAEVIALAASLLAIAGLFQLFDGVQVVSTGALRGINDVRWPALTAFVAYWIIAMPLGWLLGFRLDMGAPGLWLSLAAGLAVAAVVLGRRAWRLLR